MRAADVMTRDVLTVRSVTPVSSIAKLLLEQQISAVPVVDDKGQLLGIISEGDLLHRKELGTERRRRRWLDFFVDNMRLADEYVRAHGTKAVDVMSRPVISAKPDAPLGEIVHLLEKNRIKRMPIVDDSGKLLGLVTRSNLVRISALTPSAEPVTGRAPACRKLPRSSRSPAKVDDICYDYEDRLYRVAEIRSTGSPSAAEEPLRTS